MPKFSFSLSKLQKYQKQKQSLAEMTTIRCKAVFDQAVVQFNDLGRRLEELVKEADDTNANNVELVRAHRDHVDLMRRSVDEARKHTEEAAEAWRRAVDVRTRENTQVESYEILCRNETSEFEDRVEKAEQVELSDTIIRRWQLTEGESNDG